MAKGYPLQNSFQTGEVSPRMLVRSDVEALRTSLYRMQNMMPDARGPARSRPGSILLNYADGYDTGRVIPFQRDEATFTVVSIVDLLLNVNNGFEWVGANTNYVSNPRFDLGGTDWSVGFAAGGSVAFPTGLCRLETAANPNSFAAVYQQVTVPDGTLTYDLVVDRSIAGIEDPLEPLNIKVGLTPGGSELVNVIGTTEISRLQFNPGGVTTVFVECRLDSGGIARLSRLDGLAVYSQIIDPINFAAPWRFDQLQDIQWAMPPGGNAMYFVHPNVPPQKLTFDPDLGQWDFAPVVFIGAPVDWENENYPRTVTFFQGRSWWGGEPRAPETFYASKSGAYEDLTSGSQDDDGIVFTISQRGGIRWMLGVRNLLVGCENGEHVIDSESGIITPGDIKVQQQSAYGSSSHQPLKLGNDAIYVSGDRRKLRQIGYEWEASAWTSRDITFMAEHLGEYRFLRPTWAQNPDTLLLMPTIDGTPVACTFENREGIVGFFPCPQWGDVVDMCVVETRERSRVFLLRRARMASGIDRLFFETWQPGVDVQTDTSILRNYETPTTVVDALQALEGEEVDIIADGAVHPKRTVSSGSVTLQQPATNVIVGKTFIPLLETMPVSDLSQEGSVIKFYKRRNAIFVRVLNSSIPYINGQQPANRSPATPMNTREPDNTADYYVTNLGFDRFSMVEVTQPDPVPLTVLGIFGDQGANTL